MPAGLAREPPAASGLAHPGFPESAGITDRRGGPIMIVLVAVAFRLFVRQRLIAAAREQADNGLAPCSATSAPSSRSAELGRRGEGNKTSCVIARWLVSAEVPAASGQAPASPGRHRLGWRSCELNAPSAPVRPGQAGSVRSRSADLNAIDPLGFPFAVEHI
jgi:hypothetical protein